jgi:hypothetical protein
MNLATDEKTQTDYIKLEGVLRDAYEQASYGKGKERHANDLPFHQQRILGITRNLGTAQGLAYQVQKKTLEALDMKTFAQQKRELLGAIVYVAAMIIYMEEQDQGKE